MHARKSLLSSLIVLGVSRVSVLNHLPTAKPLIFNPSESCLPKWKNTQAKYLLPELVEDSLER